jgi:hypothetical protein
MSLPAKKSPVVFGEVAIAGKGDMLSLTDIWKAAGEPKNKTPYDWMRQDASVQFIEYIAENLNTVQDRIIKTTRGKGGGTWAHWQIALAYAKTLDHRLHAEINATYRAHQEAKTQRQASVQKRKEYTDVIAEHGVSLGGKFNGFAICTNAGYLGVHGLDAKGLREKHGLSPKANVRAAMSQVGQAAMVLTEALAIDRITATSAYGTNQCADAMLRSGQFVREAISRERDDRKQKIAP